MYMKRFSAALENYEAFWEHRSIGRPILNLTVCEDTSWQRPPRDVQQKWLDADFILEMAHAQATRYDYIAEGVPNLFANLGPGMLAACIGGSYVLAPNTVWFDQDPIIRDWDNPPEFRFDPEASFGSIWSAFSGTVCPTAISPSRSQTLAALWTSWPPCAARKICFMTSTTIRTRSGR